MPQVLKRWILLSGSKSMKRANFNITHKDGDISKRVRESMGERKKERAIFFSKWWSKLK
jgi:hypothetical protein